MLSSIDRLRFVTLALHLGIALSFALPQASLAQSEEQSTEEAIKFHLVQPPGNPPVKVLQVTVGGKPIQLETATRVSGRWVKTIRVSVENTSLKDIVEGGIVLSYPETGTGTSGSPILTTTSHLGRLPDSAFRQPDGTTRQLPEQMVQPTPVLIRPGEPMNFLVHENADMDQDRAHRMAVRLTQINIGLGPIYFADGTAWKSHTYLVPGTPPAIWQPGDPATFVKK